MNERIRKIYEKYDILILAGIILAVFTTMSVLNANYEAEIPDNRYGNRTLNCSMEYSEPRCVDGEIVTLFHNSGVKPIRNVELEISEGAGTNIYSPESPLKPNKTNFLVTGDCKSQDKEDIELRYCCEEECVSSGMNNVSDDLSMADVE